MCSPKFLVITVECQKDNTNMYLATHIVKEHRKLYYLKPAPLRLFNNTRSGKITYHSEENKPIIPEQFPLRDQAQEYPDGNNKFCQ